MTVSEFSSKVDILVQRDFGLQDGGDLCFNLIEQGAIKMEEGLSEAARIVAQHMEQA